MGCDLKKSALLPADKQKVKVKGVDVALGKGAATDRYLPPIVCREYWVRAAPLQFIRSCPAGAPADQGLVGCSYLVLRTSVSH